MFFYCIFLTEVLILQAEYKKQYYIRIWKIKTQVDYKKLIKFQNAQIIKYESFPGKLLK